MIRALCLSMLLWCSVAILTPIAVRAADPIQCGNLIFAGTQTSRCFSDEFLAEVQKKTTIPTERRFKSIRLDSEELFKFPFVVMTGEDNFYLSPKEREHFRQYLQGGGFILASAGCSNKKFDEAFRREIKTIFNRDLEKIPFSHSVCNILYPIKELQLRHEEDENTTGGAAQLEGLRLHDKLVVIYSPHGLNDTAHTSGCCCCGGNEIRNAIEINVNILLYAIMH